MRRAQKSVLFSTSRCIIPGVGLCADLAAADIFNGIREEPAALRPAATSTLLCCLLGFHAVLFLSPAWARERCRISPHRFLAECCKRQLNQGSFVLLYFRLFIISDLYWVCLCVFSCTVLFVSISQVIGCEDRLRNDLYCVEWSVKLYSNQSTNQPHQDQIGPDAAAVASRRLR